MITECAFQSSHHSDDRVTVYHGAPEPLTLCGYHAQPAWLPEVFARRNAALTALTDLANR